MTEKAATATKKAPPLKSFLEENRYSALGYEQDYIAVRVEQDGIGVSHMNYRELPSYQTRHAGEEFDLVAKLEEIERKGTSLISEIYCHRSIASCVPVVSTEADESLKLELHQSICEVMSPHLSKLDRLLSFMTEAHRVANQCVNQYKKGIDNKTIVSDTFLWRLIKLFDACVVLDILMSKQALKKDWAMYKVSNSKITNDESTSDLISNLERLFWCNVNKTDEKGSVSVNITSNPMVDCLHEKVTNELKWQDCLVACINLCSSAVVEKTYTTPSEKYQCIRVMSLLTGWVDERSALLNKDKPHKRLRLEHIKQIVRKTPLVPLFSEMSVNVEAYLSRCVNIVPPTAFEISKLESSYHITDQKLKEYRTSFIQWCSKWGTVKDSVSHLLDAETLQKHWNGVNSRAQTRTLTNNLWNATLQGISFLTEFTCAVQEQACWKTLHPQNTSGEMECLYEGMTKNSYTSAQQTTLVEVMGMIKGISRELSDASGELSKLLRGRMHDNVQQFVQHTLRDLIRKTKKEKKTEARLALLTVRDCFGDWADAIAPVKDVALEGKHDDPGSPFVPVYPYRQISLSSTQHALLMATLETCISQRNPGMNPKGFRATPDFAEKRRKIIEDFAEDLHHFKYITDLEATATAAGDLSFLWFREWPLEEAKQICFSIESSLPFMLIDEMVTKKSGVHKAGEALLLPLCIYHDAANIALQNWKCSMLYEEIEAEMDLVVDQIMFKLSKRLFTIWKCAASSELLDKQYSGHFTSLSLRKKDREQHSQLLRNAGSLESKLRWSLQQEKYSGLLDGQCVVSLLGRVIDLKKIIGQRISNVIAQNVSKIISRAEASSITDVIEIDSLLQVLHHVHTSFVKVGLTLEPWVDILQQENCEISVVSWASRLSQWITSVLYKMLEMWCFNSITSRFIKGRVVEQSPQPPKLEHHMSFGSKELCLHYEGRFAVYKEYFGSEHVEAIVSLVPIEMQPGLAEDVFALMKETVTYLSEFLDESTIWETIRNLKRYSPGKDPQTSECYFHNQSSSLVLQEWKPLKDDLFEKLRILGNAVAFIRILDESLDYERILRSMSAAPFVGMCITGIRLPPSEEHSDAKYESNISLSLPESTSSDFLQCIPVSHPAWEALRPLSDPLRPTLGKVSSLLRNILLRLQELITSNNSLRAGLSPSSLNSSDSSSFHELYSILVFIFCQPPKEGSSSSCDQQYFGDGFCWGGAALLSILGETSSYYQRSISSSVIDTFNYLDAEAAAVQENKGPYYYALNVKKITKKVEFNTVQLARYREVLSFVEAASEYRKLDTIIINTFGVAIDNDIPQPNPPEEEELELPMSSFSDPFAGIEIEI